MTERYTIVEVPLLVALDGQGRRRSLTSPNVGNYDGHYHYFSQDSFRKFFVKEFNILAEKYSNHIQYLIKNNTKVYQQIKDVADTRELQLTNKGQ